jgi:hypothetical protein
MSYFLYFFKKNSLLLAVIKSMFRILTINLVTQRILILSLSSVHDR